VGLQYKIVDKQKQQLSSGIILKFIERLENILCNFFVLFVMTQNDIGSQMDSILLQIDSFEEGIRWYIMPEQVVR